MNAQAEARRPSQRLALLTVLGANVAVAIAKAVAAVVTGSSAMLAESLRPVAATAEVVAGIHEAIRSSASGPGLARLESSDARPSPIRSA